MDKFSPQTKNIYRIEMTDLWSASVNKPQKGFLNNLLKKELLLKVFTFFLVVTFISVQHIRAETTFEDVKTNPQKPQVLPVIMRRKAKTNL